MAMIREFFQNLLYQVPSIGISDIVDILVVSIIFFSFFRENTPPAVDNLLFAPASDPLDERSARGPRDLAAAGHHAADGRAESLYIKLAAQQDP